MKNDPPPPKVEVEEEVSEEVKAARDAVRKANAARRAKTEAFNNDLKRRMGGLRELDDCVAPAKTEEAKVV